MALQWDIVEFVATRLVMNAGEALHASASIDARVNNGIEDFPFVTDRASPWCRPCPTGPLLAGREEAGA